jgi:multidrug resistance efflux pump
MAIELRFSRSSMFRTLRVLLALGIIVTVVLVFWHRTTQVANRNAYVNGSLIAVRSQIDGVVTMENLRPGQLLEAGKEIGKIENTKIHELEIRQRSALNRVVNEENTLAALKRRLGSQQALLEQYFQKATQQVALDTNFAEGRVDEARHELKAAEHLQVNAQSEFERVQGLQRARALSASEFDKIQATLRRSEETVKARRASLGQAEAQLSAAKEGLQLDAAKALNFAELRSESITAEIADIYLQQANHQVLLDQTKEELRLITCQIEQMKCMSLKAPKRGVVWAVKASSGEYLREGDTVVQILDVDRVWVETFIAEEDCWKLHNGAPATVRLLGGADEQKWTAMVEAVRGGVGRTQVGELVAVPPPDLIRREVAVRLAFQRRDDNVSLMAPEQFLGVGRTVEVDFDDNRAR